MQPSPGLKTDVENDIFGKWHFWSEIESGFGEPGGTPPPRIPRSTLTPRDITLWSTSNQRGSILFHRSNFQEEDLIYSVSTVHYNKEENTRLCE